MLFTPVVRKDITLVFPLARAYRETATTAQSGPLEVTVPEAHVSLDLEWIRGSGFISVL